MPTETEPQTIETQVWEPDAERSGYLKLVRTKTVREVFDEIKATLEIGEFGYVVTPGLDEYFAMSAQPDKPWPQGRLCVFPVTGGSEGHYVHVEVLDTGGTGDHVLVLLGKTFEGWDAAWDVSKRLATLLGC